MADILAKAKQAIIRNDLLNKGDRVLVALSGGPDSVALLHILYDLRDNFKIELAAAHLDHSIRKNSAKDREFCRHLCRSLKIKFHARRVDVPAIAKRMSLSLEEAGRQERYAYFGSLSERYGYTKIATGHTLDDNAETVLFNIARGCGLEGLAGIPKVRGKIIRPLLDLQKEELLDWLHVNKIKYVRDSSNKSLGYSRNRIRLKIIPELEKINPAVGSNIARLSQIVSEELEYLSRQTVSAYENTLLEDGKSKIVLDLGKLVQYDKSLRKKVLREAFRKINGEAGALSSQTIIRALSIVEGESGKKAPLGHEIMIENSQGRLAIFAAPIWQGKLKLRIPGRLELPMYNGYLEARVIKRKEIGSMDRNNLDVFLDLEKMKDISVRFWQDGDKIKPLGMDGHRLLSDIFIDRKIPEYEREMIPLVLSGSEIAWIAGVMISDNFKLTETTYKVLNLRYARLNN